MADSSSPHDEREHQTQWQAEYDFWTKIISDEVARRRFNEGFEPVDCQLYGLKDAQGRIREFVGTVRICHRDFECTAYPSRDAGDRETLKLRIRVAPRKHN